MKFVPTKTKFKKSHKGRNFRKIVQLKGLLKFKYGTFGLVALESGKLTSTQISSLRMCINKFIKKRGRLKINVFPFIPVSNKPTEVRMGKGKGNVSYWVSRIGIGKTICEIETYSSKSAISALKASQYRLPIKTKIVY